MPQRRINSTDDPEQLSLEGSHCCQGPLGLWYLVHGDADLEAFIVSENLEIIYKPRRLLSDGRLQKGLVS